MCSRNCMSLRDRNICQVKTFATRGKSGFTLIELLVVVSIVALLIALLLPALQQSRMVAKQIGCITNMRSVLFGESGYETDNRTFAFRSDIPGANWKTAQTWAAWNSNSNIFSYLNINQPISDNRDMYGHSNSAMYCPDTPYTWKTLSTGIVTTTTYPRITFEWASGNATLNLGGTTNWFEIYSPIVKPRTDIIKKPSNVISHFEAVNPGSGTGYSDNYGAANNTNLLFSFHNLNPSLGYFDGHAKAWTGPGGTITDLNYNSPTTVFKPSTSLPSAGTGSDYQFAASLFDRG